MPAPHLSLGVAAPQWAPSPRLSYWWVASASLPRHLGPRTTTWATWVCPIPAQVPAEAPPHWPQRNPSSGPLLCPPPPSVALLQPPLPLWLALTATLAAHPTRARHPGTTKSPSHYQQGVCLLCTPQAPAPPHTNAPPGPHSWGMTRLPFCLCTAQSGGHWGKGTLRLGEFRSRHLSMGLQAGKEGWLAIEQNSKSGLSEHEAGLHGWPTLLRGDLVRNSRCPIHELQVRTNKDKGKDGQGWVMGNNGQGWVMGKGKDGQGQ